MGSSAVVTWTRKVPALAGTIDGCATVPGRATLPGMVQIPTATGPVLAAADAVASERVFRPALVAFLLAVAGVLAFGWWDNHRTPGLAEGVRSLADGDLDGEERRRVLAAVLASALASSESTDRWSGMLAAIALGDRAGYAAARAPLGPGPTPTVVPKSSERSMLHLGDPTLGNLAKAMIAEAEGDRATALSTWRQVQAQCGLFASPFALELAQAALQRLQ